MILRKITLIAALAFVASAGINCSSQEDKDQYDKFYGKGRAEREESAGSGSFAGRSDKDEVFADRNVAQDANAGLKSILIRSIHSRLPRMPTRSREPALP